MSEAMTHDNGSVAIEATKLSFDELAQRSTTIEAPEVVDKETMLGKEFIVIDAQVRHKEGQQGPYVSLVCLLRDRSQIVINDGSTGIFKQVTGMTPDEWATEHSYDDGATPDLSLPLYCKRGLRVSRYKYEGKDAETYYLTGGKAA